MPSDNSPRKQLAAKIRKTLAESSLTPEAQKNADFVSASMEGNWAYARELLQNGADLGATGFNGDTAFHYAVKKSDEKLLRMLLSRPGAKEVVGKANHDGKTPMNLSTEVRDPVITSILRQFLASGSVSPAPAPAPSGAPRREITSADFGPVE